MSCLAAVDGRCACTFTWARWVEAMAWCTQGSSLEIVMKVRCRNRFSVMWESVPVDDCLVEEACWMLAWVQAFQGVSWGLLFRLARNLRL